MQLPPAAGGMEVTGGAELSLALAGGFTRCLAQRWLHYAVQPSLPGNGAPNCQAQAEAAQLPSEASFTELLKHVVLAKSFAHRRR